MTRESLRQALLDGADALRNSVAWRFMSHQQQTLSACGRQFWSLDNPVTNAALDSLLALVASSGGLYAEEKKECDPCE